MSFQRRFLFLVFEVLMSDVLGEIIESMMNSFIIGGNHNICVIILVHFGVQLLSVFRKVGLFFHRIVDYFPFEPPGKIESEAKDKDEKHGKSSSPFFEQP